MVSYNLSIMTNMSISAKRVVCHFDRRNAIPFAVTEKWLKKVLAALNSKECQGNLIIVE